MQKSRHHKNTPIEERLLAAREIDPASGCWNWTRATDNNGYGVLTYHRQTQRAHRLAASIWLGIPLDDPHFVLHECDNPPCFNPAHLRAGTQTDNMSDCSDKKRIAHSKRTHCKHGHPFSGDNLTFQMNFNGRPRRVCRTCSRTHCRLAMRRKRALLRINASAPLSS